MVCSYHYLCCITIDQDSQHQMAVVDTGPVQHLGVETHISFLTGDVEWCVLITILDIYVGITIDKDRQYLMAVVGTGPMKCSPSRRTLPIGIAPLPRQTDHLLCMAIIGGPIHLLIQRKAAIVEINNNHMNNNTVNNN